ncbi:alpha-1,6-glucosidase domain-containing protein [Salana multivorans]
MAGKLMVDSVVTYAKHYGIDGFRFDLMGHHSLENLLDVREALDALTVEEDGVDGSAIYLYGEGWNFGEVADNRLFVQATQANIAGSDIGTFNDRLRDAVRGGGPFDPDQRTYQGFGSGQFTDPNETAAAELTPETQRAQLLHNTDLIRVGLAGSLQDFELLTSSGEVKAAKDIDYNGQRAGYTSSPQEAVNYVEAHDNETLFDNSVWKLPTDATMDTRIRSQVLSNATVLLGQSPAFLASGTELLRSKSLDRDSYNSGDWFNAIDWTGTRNTFGTGLPGAEKNQDKWGLMRPLLADPGMRPDADAMAETNALVLDLLRIRSSSPLFTLGDADLVQEKLTFPNAGPDATPGLLAMVLDDTAGADVDPDVDEIVVVFNASPEPITEEIEGQAGRMLTLHPAQAEGADAVVKTSSWDAESGTATVPGWTVAVFVEKSVEAVAVEISPDGGTLTSGRTLQLRATVTPAGTNQGVTWTSSDPAVAFVTRTGLVLALRPGTATITATSTADPTASDSVTVTVTSTRPGWPGVPGWPGIPGWPGQSGR